MRIAIIYYGTGQGLDQDARILRECLEIDGHEVTRVRIEPHCLSAKLSKAICWMFHTVPGKKLQGRFLATLLRGYRRITRPTWELAIFIERIHFGSLFSSGRAVVFPHQEWFQEHELFALYALDAIYCKTRYAVELFREHHACVHYVGFSSDDRYSPDSPKDYSAFLHVAGKSEQKGTRTIMAVWSKHPEWPLLHIYCQVPWELPDLQNVELVRDRVPDDEIKRMQNACGVHLCLSEAEGFGHYLVEAMSTCALVLTTNGAPMNELVQNDRGALVDYAYKGRQRLSEVYFVSSSALEQAVGDVLQTADTERMRLGQHARQWYLQSRANFHRIFRAELGRLCGESDRTRRK